MKTRFHEEARHTAFCPAETTNLVSARLKLQPPLFQAWHLSGKVLEHARPYDRTKAESFLAAFSLIWLTSILVVIMRLP
jgi:hypothetical protein